MVAATTQEPAKSNIESCYGDAKSARRKQDSIWRHYEQHSIPMACMFLSCRFRISTKAKAPWYLIRHGKGMRCCATKSHFLINNTVLAIEVAFYMDKEHLKEGSDSRQSGCLEIRYVAACCMFLLKRNHACDTCGYGKEWLLKIECKFYYNEIWRIFDGIIFSEIIRMRKYVFRWMIRTNILLAGMVLLNQAQECERWSVYWSHPVELQIACIGNITWLTCNNRSC